MHWLEVALMKELEGYGLAMCSVLGVRGNL